MENMNNENKKTFYVSDLLKLLVKKAKVLCIVAVVAAILGGGIGAVFAYDAAEYTAELDISVTPVDDSGALLNSLRSGRFAELLLLDKNGLPPKAACDKTDYENALAAIKAFDSAREKKHEKYIELSMHHITDVENTYKRLEEEYKLAFAALEVYKGADGETVNNEDHLKMTAKLEEEYSAAKAKLKAYGEEYYLPALQKRDELQKELLVLNDEVKATRKAAEEAREKVLEAWRSSPDVEEQISSISSYTTYNYFEANNVKPDATDKEELDVGYIKVSISVPAKDKEMIDKLIDAYKLHICDYVEKETEKITNANNADCVLITPAISVVEPANSYYVFEILKYAVVGMIALPVLVYLFFLCKILFKMEMDNSKD